MSKLAMGLTDIETGLNPGMETEQKALENIRKEKVEGLILRSKALWYEKGEKSTNYFCNLEKRNYVNKTLTELFWLLLVGESIGDPSPSSSTKALIFESLESILIVSA